MRDRDGEPVRARLQVDGELDALAQEVLLVVRERGQGFGIELFRLDDDAVDPERQLNRVRTGRPRAARDGANHVVGFDRDAVLRVKRVGEAEAR